MKYKIGDKVKIREDLIICKSYGTKTFVPVMKEMCDTHNYILTIKKVFEDNYIMEEDETELNFSWTDEMIEGLVTDEMIEEPTDREKFEGWMRKLSRLDSKDDTWKAFDRLTYLEADDVEDKEDFEKALKLVADYLFGVEKKKMTKAEIEAELGYSIEIVEE